jgi:hypothetical protein
MAGKASGGRGGSGLLRGDRGRYSFRKALPVGKAARGEGAGKPYRTLRRPFCERAER